MTDDYAATGWQAGVGAVLMLLLTIAVVSDIRQRRIPNVLVLVTLVAGVLFHSLGPQASGAGGLFSMQPGPLGGWRALGGALAGLLLFLPFYVLRLLGAGDVKLLAAVGAFAGTAAFLNIALWVLLAGGVLALARMAWTGNAGLVLFNVRAIVGQRLPGRRVDVDVSTRTAWRMPYAVAIASGVVAYGAWILGGHTPWLDF
ncbi:MAG: prepilin peptidase [Hydrogenophaga sp.]|jgi:prepilin peptidase CpaA|nr:prepilin peptidase [Hydrogenophaga sp.]